MSASAAPARTIPEALAFWATETPGAVALIAPGREPITYVDLHDAVERLSAELRARGLGRQDRIALLFPEGPELCLALLAAISVGVAVPLAWPGGRDEYRTILRHRRVRAVLVSNEISRSPPLVPQDCPVISFIPGSSGRTGDFRLEGAARREPAPESLPGGDDIALILHSSGTTGRPKLVPRLHQSIVSTCRAMIEMRAISAADCYLTLAKTAYSQGLNQLMTAIFSGSSIVNVRGPDLRALPLWLQTYRPTNITTTPAVLRTLARSRGALGDAFRLAPLRNVQSSAGSLSSADVNDLESMIGAPILNAYGMSEAPAIAGERYPRAQRVPGSVGVPWCDVQILAEDRGPVGSSGSGEIIVRGERIFPGYLDDPEANAAAFLPGGWLRTGDVGFLAASGHLHLTGRRGEIINRGGEKIVPLEVDAVLLGHPAVAEAAVFAVSDARLGEDVIAAVVLRPGKVATARELRRWMLARLSPFKVPRRIWEVDRLPRTPTDKVQRGELSRRWSDEHG